MCYSASPNESIARLRLQLAPNAFSAQDGSAVIPSASVCQAQPWG